MPAPKTTISAETAAKMRQDYVEGVTIAGICDRYDVNTGTVYFWLDGGPKINGERQFPPLPRRREVIGKRKKRLRGDRVSLVARLWRTAERQVADIETRLRGSTQAPSDRERDARALAVLVKTLRELSDFDDANAPEDDEDHDDDGPRDIEQFRRELARKMDAVIEARSGAGAPRAPEEE